jgi:DNA-binding CsgD family transcriptional regulator
VSQPIRGRDLRALHAANAALLDLDATAADTADRLVAALGPAFGIESAWGLEVPPAAGGTAAPAPFADRASTDLADAVAGLAVLAPDAVTPRERAAADAALRILAGTTHATWHVEEFPRRLGAATYRAFQDTAIYRALFAPGRGAVATGFVTAGPRPASLVLSRRRPDRPDRRARARPLLELLGPAAHGRHVLRARLADAGLSHGGAVGAGVDALRAPALLLAPDGREAHRNPALAALLARPGVDGAAVLHALHGAGAAARVLAGSASAARRAPAGDPPSPALQVGAVPWGDGGVGILVVLPAAPGRTTMAGDGVGAALTARERQVAALLAERLTNAEVARALGVSVHTVRRHVEQVLRKLGARSRFEVRARWAAARDG